MPAFTNAGYTNIRAHLQNTWNWVAVVDSNGNEQLRWQVDANPNTTWASDSSSNPLRAELTVTGQDILDAGGSLPVTLTRTETFTSETATQRTSYDSYTDAPLQVANDEVVITHSYEVPQI